jgi:hypothetical protein
MEETGISDTPNTIPTTQETPQKKKRSPNWLPFKEEQLAISWLHISKNPKFSNNQSNRVFYRKIEVNFNTYSETHYCDFNQIKTRYASHSHSQLYS